MNYPYAIAVDKQRNYVYATSLGNDEVIKYSTSGSVLTRWGTHGYDASEFSYATGITVDTYGNVFVSDGHQEMVQKFSSSGEFLYRWTTSSSDHQFGEPRGLTSDSFGNIFLADSGDYYVNDGILRLETTPNIDGDGVNNDVDTFPFNANESADTDNDGIGNNADTDDDNDGISDSLEMANGLNPLDPSDAQADFDNDGFSNAVEISVGTSIRNSSSKPIWTPIIMGDIVMFILAKS